MQGFEKLGAFYLGRPYSLEEKKPREGLILYDSRDLLTHAVCVGMTGSGKTGLCIGLLEEAAIDGIPAIAIDPKGDLTNLLLSFPDLAPGDFRPWVNEDEARRGGLSIDEYARQQAERWRSGLAEWGQDGERIRRMRDAAEFAIYTPGSSAGLPVSLLSSFAAPPPAVREDAELLGERVATTATSLLSLVGIDADPVRSREHILLSAVLGAAWRSGEDLDLAALIQRIQTPPMGRVGVLELESFFPAAERFELALRLNNLLAAPGFAAWMEGEPLDIDRFLFTAEGKPRHSVFAIAHLNDAERMFFVSLLLNQVLGWMRGLSGTASLRAILYMDEIFGYFPPVANPPSKAPLLTLLKQARAFGVGIVLATQNPVDLDYKGLANTGTWFLGRLQTERDKGRVLDGLEGAAAGAAARFDRAAMEATLAGLGKRVFLLHNVHDDAPEVFETRWALSYLRGPLTREQIRRLMEPVKAAMPAEPAGAAAPEVAPAGVPVVASAAPVAAPPAAVSRPLLPPRIRQFFVPILDAGGRVVYAPMVYGAAHVRFRDEKLGVDVGRDVAFLATPPAGAAAVDWDAAVPSPVSPSELREEPVLPAFFGELPPEAVKPGSYDAWSRTFSRWLGQTQRLDLLRHPALGLTSRPGESDRAFRIRVQEAAREQRDEAVERLRQKYAPKIATLTERVRRAEQAVARETEQARHQQLQTAVSIGATLLGAFLGRKTIGVGTLGRATTAARGVGRSYKEKQDVGRAQETVEAAQAQLAELEAQFRAEAEALAAGDPLTAPLETVSVRPKRSEITVAAFGLAWVAGRD